MYGFTLSCHIVGIPHVDLFLRMMSQPPWDSEVDRYYLLHYTSAPPSSAQRHKYRNVQISMQTCLCILVMQLVAGHQLTCSAGHDLISVQQYSMPAMVM